MPEVALNTKKTSPMRQKVTRAFVTINYADETKTKAENEITMHQDFVQMQNVIESEKTLELACAWEEYGAAGNAHIHALLQTAYTERKRVSDWLNYLANTLGLKGKGHIDVVSKKSQNATIIAYRLKAGKADLWAANR